MLFRGVRNDAIIAYPSSKKEGTVDLYKWKNMDSVRELGRSVDPIKFHQHCYKHNFSIAPTKYVGTKLILETDFKYKNITLYHEGYVLKTVADTGYELRFTGSGSLIGSDHLTSLNDNPIKKICAIGGNYKVVILTTDGKLYSMFNFYSNTKYDPESNQIKFPEGTIVVDIDCTHGQVVALTDAGIVYKINMDADYVEDGLPLFVPLRPFTSPLISAIKCQQYRTIYKSIDGEFYADEMSADFYDDGTTTRDKNKLVQIKALSGLKVENFECSNYYVLAQVGTDDIYAVYIEEYGTEMDDEATKFDRNAPPNDYF